jgi:hypothetical protein
MGKYTVHDCPNIDTKIQHQLDTIVKILTENVPNIVSIVLHGGFGKGEGSIRIINGEVKPAHDYDIQVITNNIPSKKLVNIVKRKIYQELDLPNPGRTLNPLLYFIVDVGYIPTDNLKLYPDISTYEIKVASRLLYGRDTRNLIPWTVEDIPLSSGFRFLMEKVITLIRIFPADYYFTRKKMNDKEIELIAYCHDKTMIEIATALCLIMRKFEPSVAERARILESYYQTEFPDLNNTIPDLPRMVTLATERKLKDELPIHNKNDSEIMDMWFICRDYLFTVIKCYCDRYFGVKFSDWINFSAKLPSSYQSDYFKPLISNYLRQKHILCNKFTVNMINIMLPVLSNAQLTIKALRNEKRLYVLNWFKLPTAIVHTAALLMIASVDRDKINEIYLRKSYYQLNEYLYFFENRALSIEEKWHLVRNTCLLFKRLCQTYTYR